MKVSAQTEQKDFQILDPGTYAAVCTQIIGIGMQNSEWQGVVSEKEKVKLRFEVPSERIKWTDSEGNEQEGPMVLWSTYTLSLHENAKLRGHLEAWRGRGFTDVELMGFELDTVLGKPCMINIIHREYNGKTYANIDSMGKLMKGIDVPEASGDLISFDPYDKSEVMTRLFMDLPEWLQKLIENGRELRNKQRERARAEHAVPDNPVSDDPGFDDDDIPF